MLHIVWHISVSEPRGYGFRKASRAGRDITGFWQAGGVRGDL